jgi:hypothetical protein
MSLVVRSDARQEGCRHNCPFLGAPKYSNVRSGAVQLRLRYYFGLALARLGGPSDVWMETQQQTANNRTYTLGSAPACDWESPQFLPSTRQPGPHS